jgi:hypothetical protein
MHNASEPIHRKEHASVEMQASPELTGSGDESNRQDIAASGKFVPFFSKVSRTHERARGPSLVFFGVDKRGEN